MKKILYVVNVDWFFISHRLPIALKAQQAGYEIHLACRFTEHSEYLEELGIKLHPINFSRSGRKLTREIATLFKLRKTLLNVRADVVHCITIKAVIYTGLSLYRLKYKPAFLVAISGLGYVFSAFTLRSKLIKIIVSLLYKIALKHPRKIVVVQNESDKALLLGIAELTRDQLFLIKGSGVDLSQFCYTPEQTGDSVNVVMASRLLREKGVYDYVQAAKLLKAKGVNAQFLLVGEPDYGNPSALEQQQIDAWHASGVIKAMGHQPDMQQTFAQANIVVLPSYYGEGVPKVLIEAAACGRAIVTTDNPGCSDTVLENKTGLLVPKKDPNSLADAIEKLAIDHSLRQQMGSAARVFAESEFDIDDVIDKHLAIYQRLIKESGN